jgi:alcohol dehydrogenase class IV
MDALSHNLEALCSPLFHPMAEGIGMEGARLVREYLPRAVADGDDLEARMHMLVASSMGATAFQRGLGAMHAWRIPLAPCTTPITAPSTPSSCPMCCAPTPPPSGRLPAAWRATSICRQRCGCRHRLGARLRIRIGIPETLAEIGIDAGRADEIGRMAVADPSASTNPISSARPVRRHTGTRGVGEL